MKRFFAIILGCWCTILPISAQLRYPIVGTYQKMSAQGMAIWGNNAYLFNNGGHCRVLNLQTGKIHREFDLASAGKETHCATACFGNERLGQNKIPVLYIAEFAGKSRCFVEALTNDSSRLVQTIEATENGKNYIIQCWLVDCKQNCIYTVSGRQKANESGEWPVIFRKYRLPLLTEGESILLTENDKIGQFQLDFPNCLQGGTIKGKYMYIVTGFQQSQSTNVRAKRELKIIDLQKQTLKQNIDLTFITTNEPEGFDFYGNSALMSCGQEGGIYEIKLK